MMISNMLKVTTEKNKTLGELVTLELFADETGTPFTAFDSDNNKLEEAALVAVRISKASAKKLAQYLNELEEQA